jgi:hypothetical protein
MAKVNDDAVQAQLPLPLPIFHMLLALSEGERHGYALKREILRRTDGNSTWARALCTARSPA